MRWHAKVLCVLTVVFVTKLLYELVVGSSFSPLHPLSYPNQSFLFLTFSFLHHGLGRQLKPTNLQSFDAAVTRPPSLFTRPGRAFPVSFSGWKHEMLRVNVVLKIASCNMDVAKYSLYAVARKVDACNIPRKIDAVLRKKSLLQVVPCNTAFMKA